MEERLVAVQPDRPSDVLDGQLVLARLVSQHAEQMKRIGMVGIDLQDLPVELLRCLEVAGLVMLQGQCQCFSDRCHADGFHHVLILLLILLLSCS